MTRTSGSPRKHLVGREMEARDALNLYLEDRHNVAHMVQAFVVDQASVADRPGVGIGSLDDAIAFALAAAKSEPLLRERLVRYPADLHFPFWVDDGVPDLRRHVTLAKQPDGDHGYLERVLADMLVRRLDVRDEPPWLFHVITSISGVVGIPDGSSVLIVKFHHSALDGTGTAAMMRRLLGAPADLTDRPASPATPVLGPVAAARSVPRQVVRALRTTARYLRLREAPPPRRQSTPATRFNGEKEPDPVVGVTVMDLDRVRRISAVLGAAADRHYTVNDMVMAILSLALSDHLGRLGELPDRTLAASVPVNTRDMTDSTAANNISVMSVPLHTDVADPAGRLTRIHDSAAEEKNAVRRSTGSGLVHPVSALPSPVIPVLKLLVRTPPAEPESASSVTSLSNVRYGEDPLTVRGAPVVAVFGVLPTARGHHLTHSVRTLGSVLTFTVVATRQTMPVPADYVRALDAALGRLDEEAERSV